MHSTSTSAFFGKVFTAIAERAGNGSLKNSAYTSFMAAKSFISERKTVVFITLARLMPASSRIAFAFVSDWRVCSLMPPGGLAVWANGFWSLACVYYFHNFSLIKLLDLYICKCTNFF